MSHSPLKVEIKDERIFCPMQERIVARLDELRAQSRTARAEAAAVISTAFFAAKLKPVKARAFRFRNFMGQF